MACMRRWRPTISRMVFTSPPSMRMACKQLAEFGDNFKDCLHKSTFHADGLHAPMEANNLKDCLHKPTFHEDGLRAPMVADNLKDGLESQPSMRMACKQLAELGDNFKDCLHKPTFHADGLHAPMEANNL